MTKVAERSRSQHLYFVMIIGQKSRQNDERLVVIIYYNHITPSGVMAEATQAIY